ncbi:MAG TPA: hypothetical protein VNH13_04255 [Candidatus Acidoferrales bacterium]|nr:hypothetical protein [Candidatus Acidoferrales bacterium]
MPDDRVLERIASWEAAGLIDAETAWRLRAAEATEADAPGASQPAAVVGLPSAIGSMFGPSPAIGELFAYLGAGFVLVAWHVLVISWQPNQFSIQFGEDIPIDWGRFGLEWAAPAIVLTVAGWILARRDERAQRAAGVAFAVATGHVFGGLNQALQGQGDVRLAGVVGSAAAAIVAFLFRIRHAALLTQAALLISLAAVAVAAQDWLAPRVFGSGPFGELGGDPTMRGLATGGWWFAWALGFGLLARREGSAGTEAADLASRQAVLRRVNLTRLAAGFTAIGGTAAAVAVLTSGSDGSPVVPTWAGDLAILAMSGFLFVLASRVSSVYLYPGAVGVIVALTSLNQAYVAEQTGTGVALLVEGGILLLAGLFADRLRRRLAGRPSEATAAPA